MGLNRTELPSMVTSTFIHIKDDEKKERIIFPFTVYDAVLNKPNIIRDADEVNGAPFIFAERKTVKIPEERMRDLLSLYNR
jgi:hypothetical protein